MPPRPFCLAFLSSSFPNVGATPSTPPAPPPRFPPLAGVVVAGEGACFGVLRANICVDSLRCLRIRSTSAPLRAASSVETPRDPAAKAASTAARWHLRENATMGRKGHSWVRATFLLWGRQCSVGSRACCCAFSSFLVFHDASIRC